MKKLFLLLSTLISFYSFSQGINKVVPQRPNPPRLVNDFAGVLTVEQLDALERKVYTYDDSTTVQIAIVTVKTTGDYDIADVGREIIKNWGVGSKEKNNGIVILAAIDDRKIDIETGYGMEGVISDNDALAIVDNDIIPNFKEKNYYRGFDAAVNSVISATRGEYKAPAGYHKGGKGGISIGKIIIAVIILIFILASFGNNNRGGGYVSRRGSGWLGPFILGNMLGRGSSGWSGGGSGWSGGGWSSGGGGGFGGFGGGSGGGGGASGSW